MKVKMQAPADLRPYEKNSRTHTPAQITQICKSIQEFGFINPVIVDAKNMIVAGHARVQAAQELGLESIPTVAADHLNERQVRAYVIADNRLAENAGWDEELLRLEIQDLSDDDFDIKLLGFTDKQLSGVLATYRTGHCDEDEAPPVAAAAVSKTGDVWTLGNHILACGDCQDKSVVEAALDGARPMLMVTDPPYGFGYDPKWRQRSGISKNVDKMGAGENDLQADWRDAWDLFPGNVAYVWHGAQHAHIVAESLINCGFEIRSNIVWVKDRFALSRGHYRWQHEPCFYASRDDDENIQEDPPLFEASHEVAWYGVKKGKTADWIGGRKQSTVWSIEAREDSGHGHGTQKPVECMRRPMRNNSKIGEAVFDPFCGSGTTIIAAETIGRRARCIEINPVYVDVAIKRWQKFTGQEALRDDGVTFNAAERKLKRADIGTSSNGKKGNPGRNKRPARKPGKKAAKKGTQK